MSYAQLKDDVIRRVVKTKQTCDWCGSNHKGRLYQYGSLSPMLRQSWDNHLFCSIGCCKSYHA